MTIGHYARGAIRTLLSELETDGSAWLFLLLLFMMPIAACFWVGLHIRDDMVKDIWWEIDWKNKHLID